MKKIFYIAMAMLLMACSDNITDANGGGNDDGGNSQTLTLSLPISVMVQPTLVNDNSTRANETTGDPGEVETFAPPANLYIFTFLLKSKDIESDNAYRVGYTQITDLKTDFGSGKEEDTENWIFNPDEYKDNDPGMRWRYNGTVTLTLPVTLENVRAAATEENQIMGRTYVIGLPKGKKLKWASNNKAGAESPFFYRFSEMTNKQVHGAVDDSQNEDKNRNISKAGYDEFISFIKTNCYIDCSDNSTMWTDDSDRHWTSEDFKCVYSTPVNDDSDNGTFVYEKGNLVQNEIRLYHAAAKYDFQWEVTPTLRREDDGVWVNKIDVIDLPNKITIFNPTNNPAADAGKALTANIQLGGQTRSYDYIDQYYLNGLWMEGKNYTNDATNLSREYYSPRYKDTDNNQIDNTDAAFIGRRYVYAPLPESTTTDGVTNTTIKYNVQLVQADVYDRDLTHEYTGTDKFYQDVWHFNTADTHINPSSAEANWGNLRSLSSWYKQWRLRYYYYTGEAPTDNDPYSDYQIRLYYQTVHDMPKKKKDTDPDFYTGTFEPDNTFSPWLRFRARVLAKPDPDYVETVVAPLATP